MRKVICFLGKAKPGAGPVKYRWTDGGFVEGRVFAEVLLKKESFDQMLVFVTEEARKTAFPILESYQDQRVQPVDIGEGRSEDEIWKIFEKIITKVDDGDEIIFDITHGFRSLPFLTFLFAAYLKTARQATITAVYYGALEMIENEVAPVLDLSRFVEMLDWITATDQFIETGDARRLTGLLEKRSNVAKQAADKLANLSQASALCQPFSLGEEALGLPKALGRAANDFATTSLPFTILGQRIEQRFTAFALPKKERSWQRVQQHSRMRLQRMAEWFERAEGTEAIASFYRKLLQTELSSQQALVQLGWGAGWDAKTFSTHLQANAPLFERIMNEYKLQRRSRSAPQRRNGDPFPQSRRVAVSVVKGNKPVAPFGWALLEWEKIK